jgi:hypothetical protein
VDVVNSVEHLGPYRCPPQHGCQQASEEVGREGVTVQDVGTEKDQEISGETQPATDAERRLAQVQPHHRKPHRPFFAGMPEDKKRNDMAFGGHTLRQGYDLLFRSADAQGGEDIEDSHGPHAHSGIESLSSNVEIIPCPARV